MKVETRKRLDLLLVYIPFIILALVLIVIAGRLWYGCMEEKGKQDAIDGGVIVEAEMVRIHYESGSKYSAPDSLYSVWYKYIDENGIEYSGVAISNITSNEAKSYLGKKVEIYIDGRGNSIVVGNKTNVGVKAIVATIMTILSVGAVGFDIWLMFFQGKKLKRKETANKERVTQKNVPKGKRRV